MLKLFQIITLRGLYCSSWEDFRDQGACRHQGTEAMPSIQLAHRHQGTEPMPSTRLAHRYQGAEAMPSTQLAHRYLILWFYYYKCTMAPSHSGNLDSTCSSYPFLSPCAGPYRSIQTMCGYKTHLTETVQLIAYSDAVSPAVQELYRTMPRVSRMPDCLIHICKLQDAVAPFIQALGTVRTFHTLERSFLEVGAKL